VTSNRAARPELVGDAALARELGGRRLERSQRYSWAKPAKRTLDVYRKAASGRIDTGAQAPR
jgi:hypothetical protein